jgi:hypothetical protein
LATALFLLAFALFTACGKLRLPEALRKHKDALEIALAALLLMSMVVHAWCLDVWMGRHPRIEESRQELIEYRKRQQHKEDEHGRATGVSEEAGRDTGEPRACLRR